LHRYPNEHDQNAVARDLGRGGPDDFPIPLASHRKEQLMDAQQSANARKRRRFSTRGFASLLLTLSLLVMSLSGVMLYVTPRGRVAHWTDWTLLGLGKDQWGAVHINNSILFVLVASLHLFLNWSMLFGYLKKKAIAGLHMKRELALATAIALVFVAGTISGFPPFSSTVALNDEIKDYWEQRAARAPVPHAEELTLEEFAGQVNLPVDDLTEALHKEGFNAADIHLTVGELGRQKGVAPSAVFAAVRKHHPEAGAMTGRGPGWGRGQGFGQRRGMESESGFPKDVQGADACSDDSEGCSALSDSGFSTGDAEGHDPGFGPGGGRGFGLGQGRGMGMGRGRGMGSGQGGGREHGQDQPSVDE
jgi:hypothetical protein